ncbi:uncharacterized protein WM277_024663 [Molossus nigricans]
MELNKNQGRELPLQPPWGQRLPVRSPLNPGFVGPSFCPGTDLTGGQRPSILSVLGQVRTCCTFPTNSEAPPTDQEHLGPVGRLTRRSRPALAPAPRGQAQRHPPALPSLLWGLPQPWAPLTHFLASAEQTPAAGPGASLPRLLPPAVLTDPAAPVSSLGLLPRAVPGRCAQKTLSWTSEPVTVRRRQGACSASGFLILGLFICFFSMLTQPTPTSTAATVEVPSCLQGAQSRGQPSGLRSRPVGSWPLCSLLVHRSPRQPGSTLR